MGTINWADLAGRLGTLRPPHESCGTDVARSALILLMGDAAWEEAVDHYVSSQPGSELARSVLRLLKPRVAVERCLSIYREGTLPERRSAVELLRVIAGAQDVWPVDRSVAAHERRSVPVADQPVVFDAEGHPTS